MTKKIKEIIIQQKEVNLRKKLKNKRDLSNLDRFNKLIRINKINKTKTLQFLNQKSNFSLDMKDQRKERNLNSMSKKKFLH